MAKIKNSCIPNMFGDGYEKLLTLDDGREFKIRNSMVPNIFGDGHEQEVIEIGCKRKKEPYEINRTPTIVDKIVGVIGLIICGIPFIAGVIITVISLIMPIIAIMGWY